MVLNINKKSVVTTSFLLSLVFIDTVFAQSNLGLPNKPISEIITSFINWLLGISLGLAILVLVYGGIVYITSAGSDRIEDAKKTITYAVLGILVIGISYSIVATIVKIVGAG